MPGRLEPLVTGEIYHVFNRGIDRRPTFIGKKEHERAKELVKFYQWAGLGVRYSVFREWTTDRQMEFDQKIQNQGEKLVDVLAYCLMPNHFHLLLRQAKGGGISKFLSNFQNSYTRYFNTKNRRVGPLFLDQFKAVRIESEEQLLHVSRYIHLNPYTSFVVKTFEDLEAYRWSSLPEYLGHEEGFCQRQVLMGFFKNQTGFRTFVLDHADYQRRIVGISHLTFEEV